MTEANREFEQSPAIEQLFQVYYRVAEEEEEGEWLLAADILQRIQKASKRRLPEVSVSKSLWLLVPIKEAYRRSSSTAEAFGRRVWLIIRIALISAGSGMPSYT